MNIQNLKDGYAYPLPLYFSSKSFDQPKYKYLQEEDTRRHQRNQNILAKIQELKLSSSLEASRSEILRQMQNEHKMLIQKYLYERKFPKLIDPHPIYPSYESCNQDILVKDLAEVLTSKIYVSTGINTDLTGPVRPIQPESNFENEKYFSTMRTTRFHESNFNQSSPLTIPESTYHNSKTITTPMMKSSHPLTFVSKNSHLESKSPVISSLMTQLPIMSSTETKSKLAFLDLSTTDSENTISGRGHCPLTKGKRRFSISNFMAPTTVALSRFLGDETSDTTTSVSKITFPPARESLFHGISSILPEVSNSLPSTRNEEYNETRQEKDSNDKIVNIHEKHDSTAANNVFGESFMDSLDQKLQSSTVTPVILNLESTVHYSEEKEKSDREDDDDTENESKSNWVNDEIEEKRKEGSGDDGDGRDQFISSFTSSSSQKYKGNDIGIKNEKTKILDQKTETEGRGHDGMETVPESEIDDLSYSEMDSNSINKEKIIENKSENNTENMKNESDDDVEGPPEIKSDTDGTTVLRPHQLKLKLGYDDSESDMSEKEILKSIKKPLETKLTSKETTSKVLSNVVKKEKEDDDSLDDFFDL